MFHADKHIVKMPTETAQMLSFAYHHNDLWSSELPDYIMSFSKTHDLHPCSKWMRESLDNWLYTAEFGMALYDEYQFRFNKPDKHQRAYNIFKFALENPPNLPNIGLTPFAEAMDDSHRIYSNPIQNYRNYYLMAKAHLFKWTNRNIPYWIQP